MASLEVNGIHVMKKEDVENMDCVGKRGNSSITEDGTLDRKGRPAVKSKTGKWKSAVLLLVNYGLVTFAFFGLGVNLVLFLTRVLQQENANAANNVSKWTGTVYIFSLIGAFLSDSYWGRYLTCAIFQLIFILLLYGRCLKNSESSYCQTKLSRLLGAQVCFGSLLSHHFLSLGLALLSLSSWILLVNPSGCGDGKLECEPVSALGTAIFSLSIYLIAFGNGGYQPTIATFGSDQFDEMDPSESDSKVAFFSYFYVALNAGSLFSNTILVYYEDSGGWVIGFWTSTGAAVIAFLLFLLGTPSYRHFKASGNPLTRIAQVFVAVARNWKVDVPENDALLYEVDGKESAIAGSRKISHSNGFRTLDKAATVTFDVYSMHPGTISSWKLCTVTQVEEVKCVLKMLPIWLCTIIYSVVFTQMASLFVEQGAAMNTSLGSFNIPPASMSVFDIISVIVFIFIYRRVLMPAVGKFTKNPDGLSELQRMGVGLVIGMLAMIAAGVVEQARLKKVTAPDKESSLTIMWQIPQYVLIGASEVFMYVGQLEFYNGQAPDGIKSFGSSLNMSSMSLGNYVSIILVSVVMAATARGDAAGWIPSNLNSGHLDRFFFLLSAMAAVDLVLYIVCAKWYKSIRLESNNDEEGIVAKP